MEPEGWVGVSRAQKVVVDGWQPADAQRDEEKGKRDRLEGQREIITVRAGDGLSLLPAPQGAP